LIEKINKISLQTQIKTIKDYLKLLIAIYKTLYRKYIQQGSLTS